MQALYLVLRLIHILTGVFWAGAAVAFAAFVEPSARAVGPSGGAVMQQLVRSGFSKAMGLASLLNVFSGLWLYWLVSGRLHPAWITSSAGLSLTLGGLAGVAAAAHGFAVQARSAARLQALGAQVAAGGGPPSPEQLGEIQALQGRLRKGGQWSAALLILSVVGMAAARVV